MKKGFYKGKFKRKKIVILAQDLIDEVLEDETRNEDK